MKRLLEMLFVFVIAFVSLLFAFFIFREIGNAGRCESDGKHIYSYDHGRCFEVVK